MSPLFVRLIKGMEDHFPFLSVPHAYDLLELLHAVLPGYLHEQTHCLLCQSLDGFTVYRVGGRYESRAGDIPSYVSAVIRCYGDQPLEAWLFPLRLIGAV